MTTNEENKKNNEAPDYNPDEYVYNQKRGRMRQIIAYGVGGLAGTAILTMIKRLR